MVNIIKDLKDFRNDIKKQKDFMVLNLTEDESKFLKLMFKIANGDDNDGFELDFCLFGNKDFKKLNICDRYYCDVCPVKSIYKKLRKVKL